MKLPAIPVPLRRLLARLPQYPPSAVFAAALTLQLGEILGADAHPEFAGKLIRLHVTDAGITLTLRVTPRGFAPSAASNPDLTLTATAQNFLALALRREDPDTLFFSRRLVIEGDTELGLLVKNSLDALELKPALPAPREVLRLLRSYLP
jgi:O2-independent ubiquinone biosynthesis accessory factor UbiT